MKLTLIYITFTLAVTHGVGYFASCESASCESASCESASCESASCESASCESASCESASCESASCESASCPLIYIFRSVELPVGVFSPGGRLQFCYLLVLVAICGFATCKYDGVYGEQEYLVSLELYFALRYYVHQIYTSIDPPVDSKCVTKYV